MNLGIEAAALERLKFIDVVNTPGREDPLASHSCFLTRQDESIVCFLQSIVVLLGQQVAAWQEVSMRESQCVYAERVGAMPSQRSSAPRCR